MQAHPCSASAWALQTLFDESEEMGRHRGLGIFRRRLALCRWHDRAAERPATPAQSAADRLEPNSPHLHAPLLAGVPSGSYAYFVHSYYCTPADPRIIVATTDYGIDFASICGGRFGQGEVWGVQFQPEKSQATRLRILRNFVGPGAGRRDEQHPAK